MAITPYEIDALLPQTQCGLCGYGGCMPYASAMVLENAPIHLCPPGGIDTLYALAELLQQDPAPFIEEMRAKSKPNVIAVIREQECIGCTKCIQACPVDAIIGAAKHMHSVITSACTGCELCIPPCPVDCIDLIHSSTSSAYKLAQKDSLRSRYHAKQKRTAKENSKKLVLKKENSLLKRKKYIAEALARVRAKKKDKMG